MSRFHYRKQAEVSEIERSRLGLGMQVGANMGLVVDKVAGIRAIGAESRLEGRSKERGVRDLDLVVDFDKTPAPEDISLLLSAKYDAEEKTKITVDLIGPGIPRTMDSMEHLLAVFDAPIQLRGFPIYWKDQRYLDYLLALKVEYSNRTIPEAEKLERELQEKGLRGPTIIS